MPIYMSWVYIRCRHFLCAFRSSHTASNIRMYIHRAQCRYLHGCLYIYTRVYVRRSLARGIGMSPIPRAVAQYHCLSDYNGGHLTWLLTHSGDGVPGKPAAFLFNFSAHQSGASVHSAVITADGKCRATQSCSLFQSDVRT